MKKYCINLDRRADRWEYAQDVLDDMGWEVERFSAVDEKPGWKGCAKSHIGVINQAIGEGHKAFMVLEDDVMFLWKEKHIWDCMQELPEDWDLLYLGASPQQPQKQYSPHLYEAKNCITTHAMIWHNREYGALQYLLYHQDEIGKIDVFLADEIQSRFNCFLAYPLLCTQVSNDSDIAQHSDVSTIIDNYNMYCR